MKYLKKYEDLNESKYEVGDYILLNNDLIAYILSVTNNYLYPYVIIDLIDDSKSAISEDEIKRKITKEEVELLISTNKFNL